MQFEERGLVFGGGGSPDTSWEGVIFKEDRRKKKVKCAACEQEMIERITEWDYL